MLPAIKPLLGPAARALRSKRIVFVADGALANVPFAALQAPGPGRRPLVVDHEIVVAPSGLQLYAMRLAAGRRTRTRDRIAVIADPVYARNDARARWVDPGFQDFARLPGAAREAQEIAEIARTRNLDVLDVTGFEANRQLVMSGRLSGYGIITFATAVQVDPEFPALSALVLSQLDEAGHALPERGRLYAFDIARLHLPAGLVVLSSCRTAMGSPITGREQVGLAEAFFMAGARSILANVWDAEDAATAILMGRFYRNLLRGGEYPVAALRSAQLEMMLDSQWHQPRFWAGYELEGDWW